jgi:hypothetical protein
VSHMTPAAETPTCVYHATRTGCAKLAVRRQRSSRMRYIWRSIERSCPGPAVAGDGERPFAAGAGIQAALGQASPEAALPAWLVRYLFDHNYFTVI